MVDLFFFEKIFFFSLVLFDRCFMSSKLHILGVRVMSIVNRKVVVIVILRLLWKKERAARGNSNLAPEFLKYGTEPISLATQTAVKTRENLTKKVS